MSGLCNPTCVAADLSIPDNTKLMSSGIDATGNPQTQSIAMDCKEGRVWGTFAIVDHKSSFTAGIKVCRSEKSTLSWREAVTMIVQNSKGEDL